MDDFYYQIKAFLSLSTLTCNKRLEWRYSQLYTCVMRNFLISPGCTVNLLSPLRFVLYVSPSLCLGIRTVLTSLMTGLKQSLWNPRSQNRRARNYVCIVRSFLRCYCSCPEGEVETASRWNPWCSHRAARNLREIVSPDLPNEQHRDFVNHSPRRDRKRTGQPLVDMRKWRTAFGKIQRFVMILIIVKFSVVKILLHFSIDV